MKNGFMEWGRGGWQPEDLGRLRKLPVSGSGMRSKAAFPDPSVLLSHLIFNAFYIFCQHRWLPTPRICSPLFPFHKTLILDQMSPSHIPPWGRDSILFGPMVILRPPRVWGSRMGK